MQAPTTGNPITLGAVLAPEAPLIALGTLVGGAVMLFARLDEKGRAVLATAGSFSAISALFGGSVVGGMMLTESGLAMGSQLLVVLLPGFVAAAIGYVLFVSPTLGVAVGAAAGMAAGTWLLITSALFASLLVARRAWTRFRQPSWPRAPPG